MAAAPAEAAAPAPARRRAAARLGRPLLLASRAVLGAMALVVALTVVGTITGLWGFVPVLTGSMRPGIKPGDLVLVSREPVGAVRPGQILDFQPPGEGGASVVHRVVSVIPGPAGPVIHTRGDANNVADPWKAQLAGTAAWRVRAVIPKLGYLSVAEHNPYVRLSVEGALLVGGLGLGLTAIWGRRDEEEVRGPLPAGMAAR